jgi:hypothetical protein
MSLAATEGHELSFAVSAEESNRIDETATKRAAIIRVIPGSTIFPK